MAAEVRSSGKIANALAVVHFKARSFSPVSTGRPRRHTKFCFVCVSRPTGRAQHTRVGERCNGRNVVVVLGLAVAAQRFCCPGPALLPNEGGIRIPMLALLGLFDFTSSILPFARLIPGTTQSPQLHCMPCQAYLPTLVLHFGHSSRPSSFPCPNSGRIHDSGSTK